VDFQERPPKQPQHQRPPEHADDAEPEGHGSAQGPEHLRPGEGSGKGPQALGFRRFDLARLDLLFQRLGLFREAFVHLLLKVRLGEHGHRGEHAGQSQQQRGHDPIGGGPAAGPDVREHRARDGKDIQQPRRERHRGRRRSFRQGFRNQQRFFHKAQSESKAAQPATR